MLTSAYKAPVYVAAVYMCISEQVTVNNYVSINLFEPLLFVSAIQLLANDRVSPNGLL